VSRPKPWFKCSPGPWLRDMGTLPNVVARNAYVSICFAMYDGGGFVLDVDKRNAALTGSTLGQWRAAKMDLTARGFLYVENGQLRNPKVDEVFSAKLLEGERKRRAGKSGAEARFSGARFAGRIPLEGKTQSNQRPDDSKSIASAKQVLSKCYEEADFQEKPSQINGHAIASATGPRARARVLETPTTPLVQESFPSYGSGFESPLELKEEKDAREEFSPAARRSSCFDPAPRDPGKPELTYRADVIALGDAFCALVKKYWRTIGPDAPSYEVLEDARKWLDAPGANSRLIVGVLDDVMGSMAVRKKRPPRGFAYFGPAITDQINRSNVDVANGVKPPQKQKGSSAAEITKLKSY
jgi:uncharacterized protein YdaU (DUF1376 family)